MLSTTEQLALTHQRETLTRRQAAMGHRLAALAEAPVAELGAPTAAAALVTLLRITKDEAGRRVHEARDLAPRRALTGQVLAPVLPGTAAAQQQGRIGAGHVKQIREFFGRLPCFVDPETRVLAEAQLAEIACGVNLDELRAAAHRLAALLDEDGRLTDADRARRRYLSIGKQQPDGMSELRARLDPEGRAVLDAVFAKLAAPGMCNPDDEANVWTGTRRSRPSRLIAGRRGNAITMRSRRWGGRCWPREHWAATKGCRSPWSSPPPCRTCNRAPGTR
jgi:hypothetical protein